MYYSANDSSLDCDCDIIVMGGVIRDAIDCVMAHAWLPVRGIGYIEPFIGYSACSVKRYTASESTSGYITHLRGPFRCLTW